MLAAEVTVNATSPASGHQEEVSQEAHLTVLQGSMHDVYVRCTGRGGQPFKGVYTMRGAMQRMTMNRRHTPPPTQQWPDRTS
jgi:hypothetical protein